MLSVEKPLSNLKGDQVSKGSKRRPGSGFAKNYHNGNKKVKGGSWVQCPETGKLIPKEEFERPEVDAPAVMGDIESFVSPITKEVISDRGQLRRHMKKHGVTNSADYSPEFLAKRRNKSQAEALGTSHQAKRERVSVLREAFDKAGIR